MNRAIALLIGLSTSATGCFVSSSGRDDLRPGDVAVIWRLLEGAPDPVEVDCRPDDTVGVIIEDPSGALVAAECFDCAIAGAVIGDLSDGDYDVYLQLSDQPIGACDRLPLPEAETGAEAIEIRDNAVETPEFDILSDAGFVDVTWSFLGQDLVDGCNSLAATSFRATALVAGRDRVVDDATFDCVDGEGSLPLLEVGSYDIESELFEVGDVGIPGSAVLIEDVVLRFGGDIETVDFPPYDVQ